MELITQGIAHAATTLDTNIQTNLAHSQNMDLCSASGELLTHILCQLMTLAHTWFTTHM